MELPSFDLLWAASEKLAEFETALDQLDHHKLVQQSSLDDQKRRRKRYGGLYGVGFESENKDYYNPIQSCCDESFYTELEYQRHVNAHVKCSFDECPFVSHPKLMRVHKEVVHDGGFFQHIYRSSSDKAVQSWRESRRRNYPTVERVEAKRMLVLERIKRGDVFETKQFGLMHKSQPSLVKVNHSSPVTPSQLESTVDEELPPQASTEDNPDPPHPDPELKDSLAAANCPTPEPNSPDSGFRLVAYDTDEDSQSSEPEPDNAVPDPDPQSDDEDEQLCDKTQDDPVDDTRHHHRRGGRRAAARRRKHQSGSLDPTSAHDPSTKPSGSQKNPFASHPIVQLQAKRRRCLANVNQIHSRPTLLQMLLAEDIRRERNQLMQCVRYIVKSNFFMETDKKS